MKLGSIPVACEVRPGVRIPAEDSGCIGGGTERHDFLKSDEPLTGPIAVGTRDSSGPAHGRTRIRADGEIEPVIGSNRATATRRRRRARQPTVATRVERVLLVLPVPGVGARRELRELVLPDEDGAEVDEALDGRRGLVGGLGDLRPSLAAARRHEALHVEEVLDGDAEAGEGPGVAPRIKPRRYGDQRIPEPGLEDLDGAEGPLPVVGRVRPVQEVPVRVAVEAVDSA